MHLRKNIIARLFLIKRPLKNTAHILLSLLIVTLILSANLALAGTEDGEESPTYPDEILAPITDLSESDLILDISPEANEFIVGAINVNYEDFLDNSSNMKSAKEIAWILGQAGISRNDSIIITGECLPCGGGPAPAAYSYWILKYLGHNKVRVLDGSIEDARAAGLNITNQPATRNPTIYDIQMKPELLATYDFVKNGGAQIRAG